MDSNRYRYEIRVPMDGATPEQIALGTGYLTVATALTPEGAGDCVRALVANHCVTHDHIRVEVRHQL